LTPVHVHKCPQPLSWGQYRQLTLLGTMALRRLVAPAGYVALSRAPVCAILVPGGLTPAGSEISSLVGAVWASRVATEVFAVDLPHVVRYGTGSGGGGGEGAGPVMSVDEARNAVEGALFAHMAASPHVCRYVFCAFSMGAFFLLRGWPALSRVAAAHGGGGAGADIRGVFAGCAVTVSDEAREIIRAAQTTEFLSTMMDVPSVLGPRHATVIRCVRAWCCGAPPPARPGSTLFADDDAERAAAVADPRKHFVIGAGDIVHGPSGSFGTSVPPPRLALDKGSAVPEPMPPAPAGMSAWYSVPGTHFSMISGPVFRNLCTAVLSEMVLSAPPGGVASRL
jgi:hypothetical protein